MRSAALVLFVAGLGLTASGQSPFRTHNDRFTVPAYSAPGAWKQRAAYLREHILASAGLLPMPGRTPLRFKVFDERRHATYSVFKVYFESLPGFYVTGNLYRPAGSGPFPAILSPHGHWTYGRLENTAIASGPARAINFAEQGFVVFTYDMVGYNDSRQLPHDFGSQREHLWGLSLGGLQLWNSIRSVDFVESLPYVDGNRIGATGESGGGTQTFLLAAVDERIKVAAPVNMISLHMQGGCICENMPGLRLDTNNVELAATIAPRPLLMVSATGDWTKETLEVEYPAMRRLYALAGAEDRVHAVRFEAPHNYNRDSREAVYAWMARWLQNAAADVRVAERPFRAEAPSDLLVFYGRPTPEGAVTRAQLTESWIASAQRQLKESDPKIFRSALLYLVGVNVPWGTPARDYSNTITLVGDDRPLEAAIARAGFRIRRVAFKPFDGDAAARIQHFDTYNRTAASRRVLEIMQTVAYEYDEFVVATADFAPETILALGLVGRFGRAIIDIGQFDNTSDAAFIDRLYIPGIRRAGDLQTAASLARGKILIHNTGGRFTLAGPRIEPRKLASAEIVRLLKSSSFVSGAARRPTSVRSAAAER